MIPSVLRFMVRGSWFVTEPMNLQTQMLFKLAALSNLYAAPSLRIPHYALCIDLTQKEEWL